MSSRYHILGHISLQEEVRYQAAVRYEGEILFTKKVEYIASIVGCNTSMFGLPTTPLPTPLQCRGNSPQEALEALIARYQEENTMFPPEESQT